MTYRTKIQDGQIVVPSRLRRLAGLAEGDPLDVTFEQGKLIVMTTVGGKSRSVAAQPKKTEKQQRDEFLQGLRGSAPESLKKIWAESVRKGMDKITLRQINTEISAHRKENAKAGSHNLTRPMIRVVIDTNVVISAALKPKGIEAALVAAALAACFSGPLQAQSWRNMKKCSGGTNFLSVGDGSISTWATYRRVAKLIEPSILINKLRDEPDNRFLECADTARADFLLTGNTRHFPPEWKATIILTPREFVDLWQKQADTRQP